MKTTKKDVNHSDNFEKFPFPFLPSVTNLAASHSLLAGWHHIWTIPYVSKQLKILLYLGSILDTVVLYSPVPL